MTTIILIYFLIGWIAGFILTIYYFFHSDWDEKAISIVQAILYWPWALIIFICILIREGVKYIERKKKKIVMTSKEFQKWISNTKMDTSLSSKSKVNGIYDPEVAWVLISVGLGYWFFNYDSQKGPLDWMKLKVTYMRSGVIFYEVLDKRYKSVVKEEHVEMTSPFIRGWHEVCFTNPNPEYFKAENFDTLDGRVKII